MAIIGIDLGTTNTVVAVNGKAERVDSEAGQILPSVVAFLPNGEELVGSGARRRRGMDPKNTIFSAKRIIGQRWHSSASKEFRRRYPFELREDAEGLPVFATRAGEISPTVIAARIIAAAGRNASLDLSQTTGTIAVPSLFRDAQVEATMEAGKLAGLGKTRIIREPSATAAAYLSQSDIKVERAAVFDLGGGTFDMAIVDCTKDPFEVMGHGGDIFCGGDDIDIGLAKWAAEEVLRTRGWDLQSDTSVFANLVMHCEQAKIGLSAADETVIDLGEVDPAAPFQDKNLVLRQAKLSELAQALVRRTFIICDEVLMKVGMKARNLDAVFLAGGATHIKVVREGIEAYFGQSGLCSLDPMEVVAIGAAMQGAYDEAQQALRQG